jgi:hypothetical protein
MCDYVIKQVFDECGCNSSKYLAFDNGNVQMNYYTRPLALGNSSTVCRRHREHHQNLFRQFGGGLAIFDFER